MITLRLRGSLAACVREHLDDQSLGRCGPDEAIVEVEARTVAEALSLVGPQAPGFALRWDLGSWRVSVDGRALESAAGLWMRLTDRAYVSISPALAGAGPSLPLWQKIALGLSTAYSVYAASQIPSIPDTEHLAEDGQRRTLFSGPVNSVAQGGAVPLIYGRMRVGSTVVSGGVTPDRPTGGVHASPPPIGLGGISHGEWRRNVDRGEEDRLHHDAYGLTRSSAQRSTLRVVDLLGEGEIKGLVDGLKSVFIDGVAVEDADGQEQVKGVFVQERRGLGHGAGGQEALAGFNVTSTVLGHGREKVTKAAAVVQQVPTGYDAARVTLQFEPLRQFDDNGREVAAEVTLAIASRASSATDWTTVLTQTVRDISLHVQELSWRVERPEGVDAESTWQIQVSRVTADSASTQVSDAFSWERTAGLRDVKQSHPHSAVIGLIMETDRSDVNPLRREYDVYGRKVMAPLPSMWDPDKPTSESAATYGEGMWDGRLAPRWTNNPAWIAFDLLTDQRGGLGGVPGMAAAAYAARWEFFELARRCDELVPSPESESAMEPRWRFNGVIERREQARKVVDWVLSACRAGALWSSGHASLAVDGDSDVTAALANANVIDGEFEYQGLRWQERYSAVAVTWRDPDDDYRSGIELVVLDDLVAKYGFRQKDVAAVGCTSRGQAHRTGLLLLNEQENESETVKFGMALEGMHLRPGDRVRIADERRFELRAGFRVREVDTSVAGRETLTLDTPAPRLAAGGRIVWGEGRSAEVSAAAETLEHEIALGAATTVTSTTVDWPYRNDRLPASLGGGNVDRVILYRQGANWTAYVGASLDAGAAWESFASAVQVTHPTVGTLVLAGPDHPSSAYRDPSPPYNWFVGGDDRNEMQTWLAAYAALPAADRGGVTLRLVQPAPVNLQSPRLTTTNVPTGLGVGDLVAEESAVTDWIVTQLTERDKAEVQVEARRHDPGKYTAVEQRRELAPALRTPVAPIAAPTAVTVVERTYRDRNLVRSQLEIAVRGGDHDPRIARVEYQIQRPRRRATAEEIKAGDWSVLPRGPWQRLRITPARSIVERDVALGGYWVRARFHGGRRRSAWTKSAEIVANGKPDTLAAPVGLAATGVPGGYEVQCPRPAADDYAFTEFYDREGTAGAPNVDVDVTGAGWTLREAVAGTAFQRLDIAEVTELRVAARYVDTSGRASPAREVGVTTLEPGKPGSEGALGHSHAIGRAARVSSTSPGAGQWQLSVIPATGWPAATTLRLGAVTEAEEVLLERIGAGAVVTIYDGEENRANYTIGTVTVTASTKVATITLARIKGYGNVPALTEGMSFRFTPSGADGLDGEPGIRGLSGYADSIERTARAATAADADSATEWHVSGTAGDWSGARTLTLGGVSDDEAMLLKRLRTGALLTIYDDAMNWADYTLRSAITVTGGVATIVLAHLEHFGEQPSSGAISLHFTPAGADGEPGTRGLSGYSDVIGRTTRVSSTTPNANEWQLSGVGASGWPSSTRIRLGVVSETEEAFLKRIGSGALVTVYEDVENWGDYTIGTPTFTGAGATRRVAIPLARVESRGDAPALAEGMEFHFTPGGADGLDGEPGVRGLAGYAENLTRASRTSSGSPTVTQWRFSGNTTPWPNATTLRFGVSVGDERLVRRIGTGALLTVYEGAENWADFTVGSIAFSGAGATRHAVIVLARVESVGEAPEIGGGIDFHFTPSGEDVPPTPGNLVATGTYNTLTTMANQLDTSITVGAVAVAEDYEVRIDVLGGSGHVHIFVLSNHPEAWNIRSASGTVAIPTDSRTMVVEVRARYTGADGEKRSSAPAQAVVKLTGVVVLPPSSVSGSVSGDDVTVTWRNNSGTGSTFDIRRATSSTGPWGDPIATGLRSTSYNDNNRPNGTYYYRVRAHKSGNTSVYSAVSSGVTVNVQAPPPQTGPGNPTSVSLDEDGQNAVDLTWGAPSSWGTGSTTSRKYRWYVDDDNGNQVDTSTTTGTSARVTRLTAGETYTGGVRAETNHGNSSYRTDTATTDAATPQDAGYQYFVGALGAGSVQSFPYAMRRRWDGSSWGSWANVSISTVPGWAGTITDLSGSAIEDSGDWGRWIAAPSGGPSGIFSRGIFGTRGSRLGTREDYPNTGRHVRLTTSSTWFAGYGQSVISGTLDSIRGTTANWGFYTGTAPATPSSVQAYDDRGGWVRWQPD
ncbi:MAG: phage tail protein [Acidobacteria bacterium]|nr:phage tail protein [Acidobacteriota bacterium]